MGETAVAGRNGLPRGVGALLWGREIAVHPGHRRGTGAARGLETRPPIAAATWPEPGGGQRRERRRRFGHHGEYGGGNLRGGRGHHHEWRSYLGPAGRH